MFLDRSPRIPSPFFFFSLWKWDANESFVKIIVKIINFLETHIHYWFYIYKAQKMVYHKYTMSRSSHNHFFDIYDIRMPIVRKEWLLLSFCLFVLLLRILYIRVDKKRPQIKKCIDFSKGCNRKTFFLFSHFHLLESHSFICDLAIKNEGKKEKKGVTIYN